MIYTSTLLHWRLYVREDGRQNKWPYLSSRFSQHISEVNALHLYPELRESREMDECPEDIKEDRKQARELVNRDTHRVQRKISLLKGPA